MYFVTTWELVVPSSVWQERDFTTKECSEIFNKLIFEIPGCASVKSLNLILTKSLQINMQEFASTCKLFLTKSLQINTHFVRVYKINVFTKISPFLWKKYKDMPTKELSGKGWGMFIL